MTEYLSARIGPALYPLTEPIQLAGLAKRPLQDDLQDLYFLRYDLEQTAQWFRTRKLHEMPTDQLWIAADTFMNQDSRSQAIFENVLSRAIV